MAPIPDHREREHRVLEQRVADFPPVLTAALAADLLQVHVEYLRKMVRDGALPCHRFPGGREMRFLRDELLAWVAALPGDGRPAAELRPVRAGSS